MQSKERSPSESSLGASEFIGSSHRSMVNLGSCITQMLTEVCQRGASQKPAVQLASQPLPWILSLSLQLCIIYMMWEKALQKPVRHDPEPWNFLVSFHSVPPQSPTWRYFNLGETARHLILPRTTMVALCLSQKLSVCPPFHMSRLQQTMVQSLLLVHQTAII